MQRDWRTIRVFISSTFRDMQEEREELVKQIFPQLRKMCEERGVTWGEVDLRWGVTDEQKAEGKVLPICLEEIRRCRPYFIGILGERYGWVPEEIPRDLIEREPWLGEHTSHSVTELEILHGVLNDPAMADHAYFYFRDPAYVEQSREYQEIPSEKEIEDYGPQEAECRAKDRRRKLAQLKGRIRASGLPVREGYANPQTLGSLVLDDLKEVINRLYPEDETVDPLDRAAAQHEAFAASRIGVYIGRKEYFQSLDEHAEGDGPPLAVVGESGIGKSALLANWAIKYRDKHPADLLIMHFIGASAQSTDWVSMVRRIMGEFKRRFGTDQEIPEKPDELRAAFGNWLHMVAAKGRVVLILDALNQLEDRDGAVDLVWLPPEIPAKVRLIVSTLPGRSLNDIIKRGWPTLTVEPLDMGERAKLIKGYLGQHSKALTPVQTERIAGAPQTSNPLYLRALLEELRLFGIHEELNERIEHYLSAETVPALYELILERYEQDYQRDREGLVADAMSLVWAARRGLSEAELLDLLGSDGTPLPRAYWSPLYLAADQMLVSQSGLIGFSHDHFRQAVCNRYMPSQKERQNGHVLMADYFEAQENSNRKIEELPWQLCQAESWPRLQRLLSDLSFLVLAWEVNEFDIKAYWTQIERETDLGLVDACHEALRAREETLPPKGLATVAKLLGDAGHPVEALSLWSQVAELCRKAGDQANLQAALGGQGAILHARGDLECAMEVFKEQERVCRELAHVDGLQAALGNQAVILSDRGDLDQAMTLLKEQERIWRQLGDRKGLQASLNNQASILYTKGDLDGAMKLHQEQERISRELGDKAGLQVSLGSQAGILRDRGDLDKAMALLEEREQICRGIGDKAGLAGSLGHQGRILYARGDPDGAMALYREQERIYRELGIKAGLQACLGNQAVIIYGRGDIDAAMEQFKEQERICREIGDKQALSAPLHNQAAILQARGDLDGAIALHKEQESICRELGDRAGLEASLGNQAGILCARGDLDGAMELLKEQERVCRNLGTVQGLAYSLINQATLLAQGMGRPREAVKLAEEAYRLATDHGLIELAKQIKPLLDAIG
jgi:tetratricopeptide (TPR) repeat protein